MRSGQRYRRETGGAEKGEGRGGRKERRGRERQSTTTAASEETCDISVRAIKKAGGLEGGWPGGPESGWATGVGGQDDRRPGGRLASRAAVTARRT